jgi:cobaltochelatase CobT
VTGGWRSLGDLASVVVTAGFFGYLAVAFARRKRARAKCVRDDPSQPYGIYTTDFDLVARARDVPVILGSDPYLLGKGWVLRNPEIWRNRIANVAALVFRLKQQAAAPILSDRLDDWALCILVDQSGSLRGEPIEHVAAAIRITVERLLALGADIAVLGFSTVGWHGGRARQKWLYDGQPKRPGRLCPLLHIVYQNFGEPIETFDWDVMAHPDILRENVDGEALLWAVEHLEGQKSRNRGLIVVSDGAPVDDATLMHNGLGYLERHLRSVIHAVEGRHDIVLGAVGVGFDVDRYYEISESAKSLENLPRALAALVTRMISSRHQA